MAEEKKYNVARDVFLHVLSVGTLYAYVVSFGNLIFYFINAFVPDVLAVYQGHWESPKGSIATLVIAFPIYLGITWFLNKVYAPVRTEDGPWIRRWSMYFTLFLAAAVIIVDLIALVKTYLDGELTLRFVLKVVTVLLIAAGVFRYYIWSLRMKQARDIRPLVVVSVLAVAASLIIGFAVTGSPVSARLRQFDDQRVNDLQISQNQIIDHWTRTDRLPETLESLRNDITGFMPPADPQTGAIYEYRVVEPLKFTLCATFITSNKDSGGKSVSAPVAPRAHYGSASGNWEHDLGRTCFTRTIDPTFYRKPDREFVPVK